MTSQIFYPVSPKDELVKQFVGKSLHELPTPSAVINVAAIKRNCERMLSACKSLNLGWRAHVKTHKTVEVMQYQVGTDVNLPVNLIISTIAEAEFLLPALLEFKSQGRKVNILYGLPMAPGSVPRLAAVTKALGTDSISFLIDHPAQLGCFSSFVSQSGVKPLAWIKINMGGNRAGVFNDSQDFLDLADAALEAHSKGALILTGFYSHAGHSYGGDSRAAALKMMDAELRATFAGAEKVTSLAKKKNVTGLPTLVVSAGASPTALSVQNLLSEGSDSEPELKAEATTLSSLFSEIKSAGHAVEIHAGVYPLLDLQQLAAHSLSKSHLSWADIAMTVLAEVHSYYPNRGPNSTDEALVGAGGLALAREFCKAYDGMAILTPWNRKGAELPTEDVETYTGWMVGRFAQEHGILTWGSGKGVAGGQGAGKEKQDVVEVGQKVRLWPNHACITSSHFGWYFVVDEDGEGKGEVVVDVWVKARGW